MQVEKAGRKKDLTQVQCFMAALSLFIGVPSGGIEEGFVGRLAAAAENQFT